MKVYAILLASGIGERAGSDVPKQFLKISGKTVLEHSIEIFERNPLVGEIITVAHEKFINSCKEIFARNGYAKTGVILPGGSMRQESSRIGIDSIADDEAKVLIHDAVRPLLPDRIICECVAALDEYDAVNVAIPASDTIIKVRENMVIDSIPPRKLFMRGQTPQGFKLTTIRRAHKLAETSNLEFTDDCGLVDAFNLAKIHTIIGDETNVKITYPIDIFIADKLFQLRHLQATNSDLANLKGKVLVIFGGSGGIGKSMALIAERRGAIVHNFSRSLSIDISVISNVRTAMESVWNREKRIDFVINSAGILQIGELVKRRDGDIRDEIGTNYFGCINVARESHKYLKMSRGALLFFTSSSYTRGRALYSIYSSTKAAVVNLTQALAEEWAVDGIRVNAINPERTATPMRQLNFGNEPPESLLTPEFVAEKSLHTLLQSYTGQIVNVKKHCPC